MNNMFTTIFNNEKTPKWAKVLLKIILFAFIFGIGIFFTISSINRNDIFGIILASIYNLFMLTILYFLIKGKITKKK